MQLSESKLWKKIGCLKPQLPQPFNPSSDSNITEKGNSNQTYSKLQASQKPLQGQQSSRTVKKIQDPHFLCVPHYPHQSNISENLDFTFLQHSQSTRSIRSTPNSETSYGKEDNIKKSEELSIKLKDFNINLFLLKEDLNSILAATLEEFQQYKQMMEQKLQQCKAQFQGHLEYQRKLLNSNSIYINKMGLLQGQNTELKAQVKMLEIKNKKVLEQLNQILDRYWEHLQNKQKIKQQNLQLQNDVVELRNRLSFLDKGYRTFQSTLNSKIVEEEDSFETLRDKIRKIGSSFKTRSSMRHTGEDRLIYRENSSLVCSIKSQIKGRQSQRLFRKHI